MVPYRRPARRLSILRRSRWVNPTGLVNQSHGEANREESSAADSTDSTDDPATSRISPWQTGPLERRPPLAPIQGTQKHGVPSRSASTHSAATHRQFRV